LSLSATKIKQEEQNRNIPYSRWRRWVSCTSRPFSTAQECGCLFDRKLFWPQGRSGCFRGGNNLPLLPVP